MFIVDGHDVPCAISSHAKYCQGHENAIRGAAFQPNVAICFIEWCVGSYTQGERAQKSRGTVQSHVPFER